MYAVILEVFRAFGAEKIKNLPLDLIELFNFRAEKTQGFNGTYGQSVPQFIYASICVRAAKIVSCPALMTSLIKLPSCHL